MGAAFAGDDRGGFVADARGSAEVPRGVIPPQRRDPGSGGSDRLAEPARLGWGAFRGWKAQPVPEVVETPGGPHRDHIVRETQQIQIALAYPAATVASPDYYRARAATAILGGYSSARLFTEVREKRGLCYSVYAAYEGQLERAAMLCYAGTSTDRAQQTLDVLLDEIERLGRSGVALDELETMRAGLKSSLIMAQESSMSRSGSLASDWFFLGRVRPIEEIAAELDALSPGGGFRIRREYADERPTDDRDSRALSPAASALSRVDVGSCGPRLFSGLGIRFLSPVTRGKRSNIMQFHHTTLGNGLEVIAELNDRALSVAAGFIVKAGSRDESASLAGVSHFLEHMTFKGTDRRDAVAVNHDFDRVGAKHNAQTSEEDTFYHVTCLPEYLPQSFDVLSDILRPTLRVDDFETEKQVIIEEIRMYLDNPMSVAYEAAKTAHFGTHPIGNSILGTVESITSLEAGQMRDYFARRYSPSNIVLAFAGNAEWNELVELAQHSLRPMGRGRRDRDAVPYRGSASFRAILRAEDQQQTVVGVCSGPPLESPDRYAAHLLATILGDHTGSRLYWSLIDPGLADGAELSYQDYNQAGSFFTFLSCEPDQAAGEPGPNRRAVQDGDPRRADRGRAEPGQEQGAGPLGTAQRAADGATRVAGVSLDVPPALYPGRRRARGVQPSDGRGPAPAAHRTGRSGHFRSSRWARRPRFTRPNEPFARPSMSYVSHLACSVCGTSIPPIG